ncbi:MAG: glycosyltransferase family 2 protein [Candidatus Alcyoniella australis]|nr:glycosyltransferase family 2 protein [Candidatus Alcyoniella australis]
MHTHSVCLVIPAVDEGPLLARGVPELLDALGPVLSVRIVVNGSNNNTPQIASELAASHGQVSVEIHQQRLGKGRAIVQGLRNCDSAIVGFYDADSPFMPADLEAMIRKIEQGEADCVIASKWRGRRYSNVTGYTLSTKKLLSRGLNLVTRLLFGLPFADTQGGAKILRRNAWQAIDGPFVCSGFAFDVELLYRLRRQGFEISERFAQQVRTARSTFNWRELAKMAWELIRLRLSL